MLGYQFLDYETGHISTSLDNYMMLVLDSQSPYIHQSLVYEGQRGEITSFNIWKLTLFKLQDWQYGGLSYKKVEFNFQSFAGAGPKEHHAKKITVQALAPNEDQFIETSSTQKSCKVFKILTPTGIWE